MALEHINKLCKISGGIVGITRSKAALDRWMLTCCDLSRLSEDARKQAWLTINRRQTQKDAGEKRIARDEDDVEFLEQQLSQFNPFGRDTGNLICISTNDLAPPEIKQDLLSAKTRGQHQMKEFIENRLGENPTSTFRDTISQNKSKTFRSLHAVQETKQSRQSKTVRADRDLFKRLLSASASGREVDIPSLLSHELASVPLSLVSSDRCLRSTDKSVLSHILADDHEVQELPPSNEKTCIVLDAMALVQAIGKPSNATTFGDLADVYCKSVFRHFTEAPGMHTSRCGIRLLQEGNHKSRNQRQPHKEGTEDTRYH